MDTKCFFLCWKCLKIVEAMRDCEISGVKTKTGLLLKKKRKCAYEHPMCILTRLRPEAMYPGIGFTKTLKQLACICEKTGGHGKFTK